MYEVNNISTNTLSSAVQQVGTYTIPVAGKYQIRLMGEAGYSLVKNSYWAAGGILTASTYYDTNALITLIPVKLSREKSNNSSVLSCLTIQI